MAITIVRAPKTSASKKSTKTAKNAPSVSVGEAETKSGKPVFDHASATDAEGNSIPLDDKGRMTTPPANWTSDYANLKRSNFTDAATYTDYKVVKLDAQMASLAERRQALVEKAAEQRSGPDPIAKKQKKLTKLQSEIEKLQAELAAAGAAS